ncbi:MAG: putative ABC transporter permease [Lachnospiraceae bacterium]|nr:putative ABC transporter permease [Lachnospiraceae bacterium]
MRIEFLYQLLWLFFAYSFFGWVLETMAVISKKKKFANRGIMNGPLCCIYGVAAVIISAALRELTNNWFFLFLGSMIFATIIEWVGGKLMEFFFRRRWWDYSGKKFNLDGYICLEYSLFWGVCGVLGLKYLNPCLLSAYHLIPKYVVRVLLLVLLAILVIDGIGSYAVLRKLTKPMPNIERINDELTRVSKHLTTWIGRRMEARVEKAYPQLREQTQAREKSTVFAQGASFYKLVMLFFIGALLGDGIETIFMRLTKGVWMSRSSVVWGPFSIVWGLALALGTALLNNYRERSEMFLFFFGTLMGGAYEYFCSVFTELVFGQVFWDYSDIPFNLGGRINLLYCFFWGIAAVVWLRYLYPLLSRLIEKIPIKFGKILSWVLIVFMLCNVLVSASALDRYTNRQKGVAASNQIEKTMDQWYGDAVMKQIYPNAISTK